MKKNALDTSPELILHRHKDGILLTRPDHAVLVQNSPSAYVASLLKLPLCIVFLNQQSEVQNINEYNVAACGYRTSRLIIGKTISTEYKNESADFSLKHDQAVMRHQKLLVKTEQCERIDSTRFHAI